MANIISNQKLYKRWTFDGSALPPGWSQASLGTGQTVTVANNTLVITGGTTADAETVLLCNEPVRPRCRARFIFRSSTATMTNSNLFLELVNIAGTSFAQLRLGNGSSTCTANSSFRGLANAGKSVGTIPTVTNNIVGEVRLDLDRAIFSLVAADAVTVQTAVTVYDQNVPDDLEDLYLRIRVLNGSTAPAAITYTISAVGVSDLSQIAVEIVPSQGMASPASAVPVQLTGVGTATATTTLPISGTITLPTPTAYALNSAASTNAAAVKTSAGTAYNLEVSNEGASAAFVKLYNKASAPTVGTDVPIMTKGIPASSQLSCDFGAIGYRFSLGIGLAITRNMVQSDTTAVGANEVKVALSYV